MRRKEKEITDINEIEQILKRAQVCRLALSFKDNPYIIPMNFGYRDNHLYFHCAREGKKLEIIEENPKVCFEVEVDKELMKGEKGCNCSMKYQSVIGFGIASIIDEQLEKVAALDIIMEQYFENKNFNFSPSSVDAVKIIKVEINEMRGKKSGF
ncbi:MAG: pyridoxamine 5'-phosphate oxidase family protein [Firmicutes bacterium HGW-Firmicutes-1]|nr:MAG: pyridoxamine 5'-phosphate oxidase family protein [Firmicutes bacterium HGW-Firmicutes-1]